MRALVVVLLLAAGCAAKKSSEPAATPASETLGVVSASPPPPPSPPPSPPTAGAPADTAAATSGSAVDQARASGVLGPTDQQAFAIKSSVAIKRATTKEIDATAKTSLDAVKACYEKALEFNEKLAGEVTLSIKAGKPTVAKSTLGNAELETCVVGALSALPKTAKGTLLLAFTRE